MLMVKGDALLIVKQILGIWACKNERLKTKVTSIRKLFSQFEEVQLYHIPRKENEDADLLAQQAVSNQGRAHVVIAAIALKDSQYAGMESLTPVVNYILEGEFPKEFTTGQRRKLIKQASTFLWLEGSLYQKGKDLVCRRVPSTNEIPKILKGLHEEACGGHFSHELTLKKVLLAGYVWPSMHADVQHWCRSCHNCQVNGNKKLLYGPRQAVIANGPFEKWGIDAMGPLPRTANGKLYILVAIDYMTRWVEAQSVAKVNEKIVSKFVYTQICCRFGTPLEIVSDNGPGFRRGLLTEVCEELKISHRHSTPYYPQSNGLVEKANGIIAEIIRKMVESKPKRWDNFLDGAIWAYRTTYRDATQFTPFHLVYGQEALQPIELNIPTIKLTGRQEQSNDEAWIDRLLNLVELEWKREAAYHCYEKKALQLKDKLNEGIKDKEIKEKSLVLRYNNALDNRFDAKFERRWEGPFIVKKAFTGGYYQWMDLNGKEHPRKVNGYRLKPYLSRILPAVFETKQVSKKTKKVCCHCCSGTHQVKSCAFQHVLHEVAKDQKEKLSSPTSCPESSFQYNPVDDYADLNCANSDYAESNCANLGCPDSGCPDLYYAANFVRNKSSTPNSRKFEENFKIEMFQVLQVVKRCHKASSRGKFWVAEEKLDDLECLLEDALEYTYEYKGRILKSCSTKKGVRCLQKACLHLREKFEEEFGFDESSDDEDEEWSYPRGVSTSQGKGVLVGGVSQRSH
ncbi:hypothetical protein L7F22_056423 [Adiantum nelumboides]|nr:hypothetical protein [Adiantum nelumboides]